MEFTLSILKPDALRNNCAGQVNAYIEKEKLVIVAQKRLKLTRSQAEAFYAEHKERGFFNDLIDFMVSGEIIVQVLKGDNAIAKYRTVMGATDPQQADQGTIRKDFATSIDENCVHGSDSPESAKREVSFFFAEYELVDC